MREWINVKDKLPNDGEKVLAIFVSEPGQMYNMRHDGWFRDTIYACWRKEDKFFIESHGPLFSPTHWMPLPKNPVTPQSSKD